MWLEISADPLTLNEKNSVILAMNDITRRKEAEESLRRTSAELQRSNLDLEQFASVVSHNLQEPLRLVRGFLSLLEQRHAPQLAEERSGIQFRDYRMGVPFVESQRKSHLLWVAGQQDRQRRPNQFLSELHISLPQRLLLLKDDSGEV